MSPRIPCCSPASHVSCFLHFLIATPVKWKKDQLLRVVLFLNRRSPRSSWWKTPLSATIVSYYIMYTQGFRNIYFLRNGGAFSVFLLSCTRVSAFIILLRDFVKRRKLKCMTLRKIFDSLQLHYLRFAIVYAVRSLTA